MDYQKSLIDFLRTKIPKDITLADYIEESLHVSRDGAYRRIGGRTALTWNEAMALLQNQKMDLAEYAGTIPGRMTFDQISTGVGGSQSVFSSYIDFLSKFSPNELTFLTNTIPRNHLFDFPDLTFFQMFFTAKTVTGDPDFQGINFSIDLPQKPALLELVEPLANALHRMPANEILWIDAIDSMIKPILYYSETNQFDHKDTALYLLNQLCEAVNHLEKITTVGKKIRYGRHAREDSPPLQFYVTEVPLQDTTAIFSLDQGLLVLHVMNGLSMIATSNHCYCKRVQLLAQSIMERSSNLTQGGEKLRIQFFTAQRRKIEAARRQVETDV